MISTRVFDVMVVYTSQVALSAKRAKAADSAPFTAQSSRQNYNLAYGYFLETCAKLGLRAAFCTSSDIIGPGTCDSYWLYTDGNWKPVVGQCSSTQVFDKFSPHSLKKKLERKLLFSAKSILPFNDPVMAALFFDKLVTYESLRDFTIPTVSLSTISMKGIEKSILTLRDLASKHAHAKDFSTALVLKDRFGAGGNQIYKISEAFSKTIFDLVRIHSKSSFIIQPFMHFEHGYSYNNHRTNTDIRLIYLNGKIIQTYIRFAKKDDFRCNEHQGGELIYTTLRDIPQKVLSYSNRVLKALPNQRSLYALDYIVSDNGNVYFLEGNIGPGIDWNPAKKKNELMSKQLIRRIVREMADRGSEMRNRVQNNPIYLNQAITRYNIV